MLSFVALVCPLCGVDQSEDDSEGDSEGEEGEGSAPSSSKRPRKTSTVAPVNEKQSEQPAAAVNPSHTTAGDDDTIEEDLESAFTIEEPYVQPEVDEVELDPDVALSVGDYVMLGVADQPFNDTTNVYAAVCVVTGVTANVLTRVFPSGRQVVKPGTYVVHVVRPPNDVKLFREIIASESCHAPAASKETLAKTCFKNDEEAKKSTDNPSGVVLV